MGNFFKLDAQREKKKNHYEEGNKMVAPSSQGTTFLF
jgi:hypothetical protein